MKCTETRRLLSSYLDGAVDGRLMGQISHHLTACDACSHEYALLRQVQRSVASLGRRKAPPELTLRLQVALSQEAARTRRLAWNGLSVRWRNAAQAFMWPATAGALSAVIFFGLLIGFFALPPRLQAHNDVPTVLYTPPELKSSPFGTAIAGYDADSIVVEASIDANGRVQEYQLLSAPKDKEAILNQLNNLLIFTTFRPATAFGQPTSGKAVLSFSMVSVKG